MKVACIYLSFALGQHTGIGISVSSITSRYLEQKNMLKAHLHDGWISNSISCFICFTYFLHMPSHFFTVFAPTSPRFLVGPRALEVVHVGHSEYTVFRSRPGGCSSVLMWHYGSTWIFFNEIIPGKHWTHGTLSYSYGHLSKVLWFCPSRLRHLLDWGEMFIPTSALDVIVQWLGSSTKSYGFLGKLLPI